MAANRVGRRLGRGSPARSPGSPRAEPARSPGIQKRQTRVTVKYDRRELQRRLDTEKWIDGRLEELYRGREAEMPDEVNIDELLELDADEARAAQLQVRARVRAAPSPLGSSGPCALAGLAPECPPRPAQAKGLVASQPKGAGWNPLPRTCHSFLSTDSGQRFPRDQAALFWSITALLCCRAKL
uniref:Protein phosphatase 1 regulatory inhibitor subunit 14A n=1 Tax=Chelonoidis abingdonii TaxID=106734 RepID=A0A8C0JD63_CHEAB